MSAVMQWLRMTAACPAPHFSSCMSASRKARRKARLQQPPAQHTQQQAQQSQQATEQMSETSAPHRVIGVQATTSSAEPPVQPEASAGVQLKAALHEPVSVPRHSLLPKVPAQRVWQGTTPPAAAAKPTPMTAPPTAVDAAAGAAAVEAKAASLAPPMSGWRGTPQQEWGFMDTLAQLRSIMFEGIAVNSSEELPAAGEPCLCISAVAAKKAWQTLCGRCAIIMMKTLSPVLAPAPWPQVDADSALLFITCGKSCCMLNALHFPQDTGCDMGQL